MYTINRYTSAVCPARGDLIVYLVEPCGWVDTGQMTAHAYFILSCPLSTVQGGTKAPDVPPVDECNIIGWSRPDRAATRRLCPHRGPPRLDWHRQQGGHPHPVLGGGLVRPRSSIHSTLHSTQLYCTSLFAQLDNHCLQSGSHGPAHCTVP